MNNFTICLRSFTSYRESTVQSEVSAINLKPRPNMYRGLKDLEGVWKGSLKSLKGLEEVWRVLKGFEGSWIGLKGHEGVWRGSWKSLKGLEGVWRVLKGFEGSWRGLKGLEGV